MKNTLMKISLGLLVAASSNAFALDKIVTIESPVKVVSSTESPDKTVYWVEDQQQVKYKVVIPEGQRDQFAAMIKQSPTTVIRFDGTVVNNEASPVLNVNRWKTTTTTTTTTDQLGNTSTMREKTTTIDE